jgi:transposase
VEAREQRGIIIAARFNIKQKDRRWLVPSQTDSGKKYSVCVDEGHTFCTCPDHEETGQTCKHIYAVRYTIEREFSPDGTLTETETITLQTRKKTYPQNWRAYNAAQTNEKEKFQSLLQDLCSGVVEPKRTGRGRPRIPLSDAVFSAVFKVYSTVSGRRFMSDLRAAQESGYVGRAPSYNSIFNVLESENTTAILKAMVEETANPLKAIESHFSCDSSGFSGCRFDQWYDHKWGKYEIQRTWVKAHVMTGAVTNVITAVEIHEKNTNDGTMQKPLLAATTERFNVAEVSGDLAYSTHANLQAVVDADATPLIPFRRNAKPNAGGLWEKMLGYFTYKRDEFMARYHQRSNVESTFSMLKAKFGDGVRSKTDVAMKNEVLAKIVCHKICCLISAMYELGIDPVFWAETPVAQQVAAN